MPYDQICLRILISGNCIFHLKMRVFWLSGPNGSPDKKLKHEGNVAHRTFRGGCVIYLVLKNYSSYQKIAMFSYKWVTLYNVNWVFSKRFFSRHIFQTCKLIFLPYFRSTATTATCTDGEWTAHVSHGDTCGPEGKGEKGRIFEAAKQQ